ncbi:MAG: PTS glucitol/sorbitol transporter subunit IIA [Chloroflexota bacterium]
MAKVKYQSTVVKIGSAAQEFINEGILVFFGMGAPEELAEIAILHEHDQLVEKVVAGDTLVIDDNSIPILSIGEVANENLANLGHFVVKFNGLSEPEMPGDISVSSSAPRPDVKLGTVIKILSES